MCVTAILLELDVKTVAEDPTHFGLRFLRGLKNQVAIGGCSFLLASFPSAWGAIGSWERKAVNTLT